MEYSHKAHGEGVPTKLVEEGVPIKIVEEGVPTKLVEEGAPTKPTIVNLAFGKLNKG